ncbi:hypothetical protein FQA39_LY12906 [Lamprigera yunnana]|nr:hypothetical protein FQA39_LY12906 [Lamprigera yunnana]
MYNENVQGVEFFVANTDAQVLGFSSVPNKIILGEESTKGLGAGADPEVGRKAALESEAELKQHLSGADLIFIAAGMGGGTGTGAAPVIARIASELGALVIGIVTKPFILKEDTVLILQIKGSQNYNSYEKKGSALFGIGIGSGEDKANEAANKAISSSLLEASIKGSKRYHC